MLTYQDVSIELPESTSITIDNSPFEFMNGASFEFSLTSGKSMGLSWQYDKDEDALVCAVNFDANKGLGGKDDDKKDENEKVSCSIFDYWIEIMFLDKLYESENFL